MLLGGDVKITKAKAMCSAQASNHQDAIVLVGPWKADDEAVRVITEHL